MAHSDDQFAQTIRNAREYPATRREDDARTPSERDYARIVYSPSFRRLQGKSQIFGAGSGDYYRNRLTHSLEVNQVSRSIFTHLRDSFHSQALPSSQSILVIDPRPGLIIDPWVIEAAALAHDLGHPPYGHHGEHIINRILRESDYHLCYESNAQNYRILRSVESRLEEGDARPGLNLTYALLLALNKYPTSLPVDGAAYPRPNNEMEKGVYASDWDFIETVRDECGVPPDKRTLECQIVDLADEIAYSTHDIEDGIRSGFVELTHLTIDTQAKREIIAAISRRLARQPYSTTPEWSGLPDGDRTAKVEDFIDDFLMRWRATATRCSGMTDADELANEEFKAEQVNDYIRSIAIIDDNDGWKKVTFLDAEGHEDREKRRYMDVIKQFSYVTIVTNTRVQRLQHGGAMILRSLLEWTISPDNGTNILPRKWKTYLGEQQPEVTWPRLATDYIAGMTELYAGAVYGDLSGTRDHSFIFASDGD